MGPSCILYYVTDRKALAGDEPRRRRHLLNKIEEAAKAGVDCIQLREKDLPARELESLAEQAVGIIGQHSNFANAEGQSTRLLINSRTDVALAANANGVHLTGNDISPVDVRRAWKLAREREDSRGQTFLSETPTISISCHSIEEVKQAAAAGADLALLAPIFEKKDAPATKAQGLDTLREAAGEKIPVLALGGITLQNAASCLRAGAAGIAAIRLFQENDIAAVVRALRAL